LHQVFYFDCEDELSVVLSYGYDFTKIEEMERHICVPQNVHESALALQSLQTVPHGNVFVDLVLSHKKLLSSILQAPELELKPLPDNLKYVFIGDNNTDANLVITWSCNSHAKTPIPGKPSKSGLIGV
jgi:hypothetical protein